MKISRILVLSFITIFGFTLMVHAQTSVTGTIAGIGDKSCQIELKKFLDQETKDYQEFITKHLQNKKSANNLFDTANQRYIQYRAKLLNYRKTLAYLPGIANPEQAQLDIERCQEVIDKYLVAAAEYQKNSLIGNAQRKATIRLTERLQNINSKLDTLNRNVGAVKGDIQIFVQKVPCYVENCPPI